MKYELVEYDVVDDKMVLDSGKVIFTDYLIQVHEFMNLNFEPPNKHWMVRTKKEVAAKNGDYLPIQESLL